MHENVKFTVLLKGSEREDNKKAKFKNRLTESELNYGRVYPIRKPKLSPAGEMEFEAVPEDIKNKIGDWQPVFSDMKYGTEYSIFARFFGDTDEDDDGPFFGLEELELFIQCWKGPVSIGFNHQKVSIKVVKVPKTDYDGDTRFPNRFQYEFLVGLEGLCDSLEDTFIIDQNNWEVFNNDDNDELEKALVARRSKTLSDANLKIRTGDTLFFNTWFSPANPSFTTIYEGAKQFEGLTLEQMQALIDSLPKNQALKDVPFVDELFMERLGDDVVITHKGWNEIKWIQSRFDIISMEQRFAAKLHLTSQPQDHIDTRGTKSGPRPCQDTTSRIVVI